MPRVILKNGMVNMLIDPKLKMRVARIAQAEGRALSSEIVRAIEAHCDLYEEAKKSSKRP